MKKYLNKLLVFAGVGLLLLSSCTKQETPIYYEGGTKPVLNANLSDTISLLPEDSSNTAITFTYTNPNYIFSNGISSQNVTYSIQVDTVGSNFSNPAIQTVTGNLNLSTSISVRDMNILVAGKLGLAFGQNHKIQVRLITSLGTNQAKLISNSLNFDLTPYAPPPAVTPPSTGTLFIVGSAVVGLWSNPIPSANIAAQQFTQKTPTEYTLITTLASGMEYKFIGKNDGAWASAMNFGIVTGDDPTEINGGSFFASGGSQNIKAPTSTDPNTLYLIDVNFQSGIFTVTKL